MVAYMPFEVAGEVPVSKSRSNSVSTLAVRRFICGIVMNAVRSVGSTLLMSDFMSTRTYGLTRFSGHLSVYREGVSNGEQRNEVSSGVSEANGRIGLGGPQIWGPVQGVWSNGLDDPKMGQASRA